MTDERDLPETPIAEQDADELEETIDVLEDALETVEAFEEERDRALDAIEAMVAGIDSIEALGEREQHRLLVARDLVEDETRVVESAARYLQSQLAGARGTLDRQTNDADADDDTDP